MRKLLFWLILSAAFATAQTRPDCVPTTSGPFVLTAAAPTTNPFNNRAGAAPCLAWVVTYYTNGASGVSLTIQGTNDANGQPGTSYSTLTANSVSANPATGTNSGSIVVCCDYYPFLRLNAGTLTGTGATLTATVTGYATTIAARGSGGFPSGPAGGDLSGSYPNPSVAKIGGTAVAIVTSVGSPGTNGNVPTEAAVRSAIPAALPPNGSASGDLSGSYPSPTVSQINGAAVPASAAVLGSNSSNQPVAATGHGVVSPIACADTSVSATTYTCTTSPTFTPATGDAVLFRAVNQNNSGASTLNVNTAGAKPITKQQNAAALASGDLQSGGAVLLVYDGTNWELQGQTGNSGGTTNPVTAGSAATAANQVCVASGASRTCSYIDFPDVRYYPAAQCLTGSTGTIGAGWGTPASSNYGPPACNSPDATQQFGILAGAPSASHQATVQLPVPGDWNTAVNPYISVYQDTRGATSGTYRPLVATLCTKTDGSITVNGAVSFQAESATLFSTYTSTAINQAFVQTAQLTKATTGNNCVAGGMMFLRIDSSNGSTTATSGNLWGISVTWPRRLVLQAN